MPFTPIEPGHIATIVTSLEMKQRPALRPLPASELNLVRWEKPAPEKYRALYRRVGEPWLWFSRLQMDDAELTAIIHDEAVKIWAVTDKAGIELGILELDFRDRDPMRDRFFRPCPRTEWQRSWPLVDGHRAASRMGP